MNPGVWPSSPENKFELILGRFGHDEADAAKESRDVNMRQRPAEKAPEPKADERDEGQWDKWIGTVGQLSEYIAVRKPHMDQQ